MRQVIFSSTNSERIWMLAGPVVAQTILWPSLDELGTEPSLLLSEPEPLQQLLAFQPEVLTIVGAESFPLGPIHALTKKPT